MVNVYTEIIICRPIEQVASYAANPDHAPDWYINIDSASWLTEKKIEKGSLIAFTAQFLGRELAYTYEIIEYIPENKLIMRTADGPFPMETTYNWIALDENNTKMTLRNKGNPSGFSSILAPFMSILMKRANNKDLRKIKKIIESK